MAEAGWLYSGKEGSCGGCVSILSMQQEGVYKDLTDAPV